MKRLLKKRPILGDPVGWTGGLVGSRPRFLFILGFILLYSGILIKGASEQGLGWSPYVLIVGFQLMFLYVLRQLYLIITKPKDKQNIQ